ncbi:MAG: TonB-dependent receptor [Acidobacteriota bacterium]|nr:TonB-dependent receptor [Acidobacteriota bacterium]MDH3528806.1 TonB-dependent receptor [Acidobacteriota bacterium]
MIRLLMMFVAVIAVGLTVVERDFAAEPVAEAVSPAKAGAYGIIRGVVRDRKGKPISKATVAVFRLGTSKLIKQITATKSGKFFTKIVPGTYTVLAVAQGFNPVTLNEVKVGRSSELVYGFNLERAGAGNTLPEKRADRKSAKWAIRLARRSIYQVREGAAPVDDSGVAVLEGVGASEVEAEHSGNGRKGSSIVETYAGSSTAGSVQGVNFATLRPVGENSEVLLAGQLNNGRLGGNRFETEFSFSPKEDHQIRLRGSIADIGTIVNDEIGEKLSQVSFRATDQWRVREGMVLLFGIDYSRFMGAGNASSLTPRIGVQYDLDSRTRLRSAYTTRTEERTWSKVIQLENSQVLFAEPISVEDISAENGDVHMNRSTRFEFGVERVLDNRTNVEANVFLDTVKGRGVGIQRLPFGASEAYSGFVGRQEGGATGMRVVLNRRFNGIFSASSGYAFGTGQELAGSSILDPGSLFEGGLFQTIFGKVDTALDGGTTISTVFRFSPKATVFAIDPFEGRLAIYDPGLSVLVTQELPSWGLPIDAEATLDARNLFDFSGGISGDNGSLFLRAQRRMVRGSILVRF